MKSKLAYFAAKIYQFPNKKQKNLLSTNNS